MDKKDLESIATIVNSIVNSALENSIGILREEMIQVNEKTEKNLREEIKQSNENLKAELHQELTDRMNEFEQKMTERMDAFEQKMTDRMDAFEQKMTDRMNEFEQKMLDKMFVFEHDYGEKINTIFDVSVMQKDKAFQIYQNNEKIQKQFHNHDMKLYQLDQRVFRLEHSSDS